MANRRLILLVALVLAGCAPRDGIGDRLLGIDSITNARGQATNQKPAPPP
ncbi:MAG TPA: hypothetical protein VFF73_29310 [Planctomycetota bacterium]|nr:hypothetical protein [Planctomycetota bacterium]